MMTDFKWMDEAGEQYHRERNMDSVEKFLEIPDLNDYDTAYRLLRLCKKYREALQHIDKVCVYSSTAYVSTRMLADECGGEARDALQFDGLSGEGEK